VGSFDCSFNVWHFVCRAVWFTAICSLLIYTVCGCTENEWN